MTSHSKLLLACLLLVVALHAWGAVSPSHDNWGVHFFSFYDQSFGIISLLLLLLWSIPSLQAAVLARLDPLVRRMGTLPSPVIFLIVALALCGLIRLFPVQLHLLGDGAILLRSVPLGITGAEITASFNNQPLMFWIFRTAMNLHPLDSSPDPQTVYYLIDIVAAALFLGLIFWSVRTLKRPPLESLFLGSLLLFGGGSQFFFGYVENYVLQYVCSAAYAITGWFALERKVPIAVPLLIFLLMVALHLGSVVFLPSVVLLVLLRFTGVRRTRAGIALVILGSLGLGVVLAMGVHPIEFLRRYFIESVNFLSPFSVPGGNYPYAMFSVDHLIDWLNSQILTVPLGLVASGVLLLALPGKERWKQPALLFLLGAAGCGLFFTWVVNSALGLARDWDLFAGFFAPLLVLPVFFFSHPALLLPERRYLLALVAFLMLLHSAGWIGVNADGERHLARMKMLDSPNYLAPTTQMVYDEALANFFFDHQRYAEARTYYQQFMAIDSFNTRIVGNIAEVYQKLGERENYFRMLTWAVSLGSKDAGIYSNLGVEYVGRGDTMKAIEYNEKAIALNPTLQKAHANLGILYSSLNDFPRAEQCFQTAIDLGMRDPILFRYAGNVSVFNHKYEQAVRYYDIYLAASPNDARVKGVREKLVKALGEKR